MRALKSISSFLASVLLVAFTISSGIIIYYFVSTLPRTQIQEVNIQSSRVLSCAGAMFDIKNFYGIYIRPITISNTQNSNTLTDYQVLVTLDTASLISQGKMRGDYGDIRFTDSDGKTLLSYLIESGCNSANTRIWVRIPSIPASSTKTIYVYYGNLSAESSQDFTLTTSSYIGTEFYTTCLGDAYIRIASYEDGNVITIYRSDTWQQAITQNLNKFETYSYYCNSNYPFYINSSKPISVTIDNIAPSHNSDDDITSVYTDKIWLRIPRHLWICSYDNNNFVRIQNASLNDVWSGTLNSGECYNATYASLSAEFYYINATYPLTIQFGFEDDNIYGIIRGRTFPNGTQIYYFYSHGFTIVSSLYPNTYVKIENLETGAGNWEGTLVNEGDYIRTQQISSFTLYSPEYVRMRVISDKPVLVYTESDSASWGAEQISSISGKASGTYFVFRVGWGTRYVRIIGTEPGTSVTISGCISASTILAKGQQVEYSCGTSWGLVKIVSDKPVVVFERGQAVGEDISIVLPYKYTSPEPIINIGNEEIFPPITFNLLSSGNPSASMGNSFSSIIYLKNGTIIKRDFDIGDCNLGKDCILSPKITLQLNSEVPIERIEVCSKGYPLICSQYKVS